MRRSLSFEASLGLPTRGFGAVADFFFVGACLFLLPGMVMPGFSSRRL